MRRAILGAAVCIGGAGLAGAMTTWTSRPADAAAAAAKPSRAAHAATGPSAGSADVLQVAREVPDGGGYNREWSGTGTPTEIRFAGQRVLAKGTGGTYCCGFTFAVAMAAAERRGLLAGKTFAEVKAFQKDWYGATEESREKQCAFAVERLGVGRAVAAAADVKPGDFCQIWRVPGPSGKPSGHSVVFVDWVVEGGERVGLTYRSSQGSTDGVATSSERFSDAKTKPGRVDRARTYFCRLSPGE